jgi:hypothetical protein
MKKQQREPGMELVPLEYVMTAMQRDEREEREGGQLAGVSAEPVSGQEADYEHL